MKDFLVRPNWRDIDILELTDAEEAQMTDEEQRWCSDRLLERHRLLHEPASAEETIEPEPIDIDGAAVVVMESGDRIRIIPGEGFDENSFAGELLNPTERQMRGQGHMSCLWDRSKVAQVEARTAARSGDGSHG